MYILVLLPNWKSGNIGATQLIFQHSITQVFRAMKCGKTLTVGRMPQQGMGCGRGVERGGFCHARNGREETVETPSNPLKSSRKGKEKEGGRKALLRLRNRACEMDSTPSRRLAGTTGV